MARRGRLHRLEAIRGFAAAVVMLGHARLATAGVAAVVLSTGQEAVIVFFLLSGFVIHHATLGRGPGRVTFVTYFLRRFRRIYPLLGVCLALTYATSCLAAGRWIGPDVPQLAGNLAMFQDMAVGKRGVWVDTYLGNWPLWSLAYEWWFYMLFFPVAVALAIPSAGQKYLVAGLSVLGYVGYHLRPNPPCLYLSYFVIWWAGVELSREHACTGTLTWRGQLPMLLLLAGSTLLWGVPLAGAIHRHSRLRLGLEPVLQVRHFADAAMAVGLGLAWYKARFRGFGLILGPFGVVAPIAYALYICHVPIYVAANAVLPQAPAAARLAVSVAVLVPLAYGLEVVLQKRVNAAFDRLEAWWLRRAGPT